MEIKVQRAKTLKPKPQDESTLVFGRQFTDHMFVMDYETGKGWHDARIVPYGPFQMDPATTCLHYGQTIFEGLKAYRTPDGRIVMFRPDQNMRRMNESAQRMCIPQIDEAFCVEAIRQLVELEKDWVPSAPNTSLYIRPYMFSSDVFLGVHAGDKYTFAVILSPVGPYYKGGLAPVKIYVEDQYVRAVKGGTGAAKCGGNYAASLRSQVEAAEQGYAQVLWLDGVHRKYIEEVGAMNVFFVIDGEAVTPAINGSILSGITRKSIIEILKSWNVPVSERAISIDEIAQAYKDGKLQEAFGAGTAAVISPMGELKWRDTVMHINDGKIGSLTQKLYDELFGIQTCNRPDTFGWVHEITKP